MDYGIDVFNVISQVLMFLSDSFYMVAGYWRGGRKIFSWIGLKGVRG